MNEVRLLSARDLQQLFPDAEIPHERFLGLSENEGSGLESCTLFLNHEGTKNTKGMYVSFKTIFEPLRKDLESHLKC